MKEIEMLKHQPNKLAFALTGAIVLLVEEVKAGIMAQRVKALED
jgi:hypothetical protein